MPKINKILVPTDFSENASSVFKFVRRTAKKYNARVDLIYVIPEPPHHILVARDPHTSQSGGRRPVTNQDKRLLEKLEEEMKKHLDEDARNQAFVVSKDRPSTAIIKHAQKEQYDLIMIASRGRGNSLFVRGSVTERLIRLANTPVISANKGYSKEINTILVPTDGSKVSLEALPMASKIAEKYGASIHLLNVHVFESITVRALGGDPLKYSEEKLKDIILKKLTDYIENETKELEFAKKPSSGSEEIQIKNENQTTVALSIKIKKGFSAHAPIVEYAQKNAELVIMATHGRSAMANLFIGSTTEKVARHLKLPVMTIKSKLAKKKRR